jgi:hypothetical protein
MIIIFISFYDAPVTIYDPSESAPIFVFFGFFFCSGPCFVALTAFASRRIFRRVLVISNIRVLEYSLERTQYVDYVTGGSHQRAYHGMGFFLHLFHRFSHL